MQASLPLFNAAILWQELDVIKPKPGYDARQYREPEPIRRRWLREMRRK